MRAFNLLVLVVTCILGGTAFGQSSTKQLSNPITTVSTGGLRAFLGNWSGFWQSNKNMNWSGRMRISMSQAGPAAARADITLSNAVVPGFSRTLDHKDGKLVSDDGRVTITFWLESGKLKGTYSNTRNNDQGVYNLDRE